MYSVTKRIEFCYGHRLLDYDGVCKHPHGHNAVAEIEVRTGTLDNRNMVCDFSDIKRVVKGWIDRELDHKMILRHDDPLVTPLRQLGEPVYIVDSNPTVERIARLIFDQARDAGMPVVRVTVWETPTSFAEYREVSSRQGRCGAVTDLGWCTVSTTSTSTASPRVVLRPRPLRIAMVAPPYYTVPPKGYGGVESVVAGLVDRLVARGHHVTLFAAGTRGTAAQEFVRTWELPPVEQLHIGSDMVAVAVDATGWHVTGLTSALRVQ
jgi:6-pyruvoyltetrahydropterin/6-carboxytetrahydropterin synthase